MSVEVRHNKYSRIVSQCRQLLGGHQRNTASLIGCWLAVAENNGGKFSSHILRSLSEVYPKWTQCTWQKRLNGFNKCYTNNPRSSLQRLVIFMIVRTLWMHIHMLSILKLTKALLPVTTDTRSRRHSQRWNGWLRPSSEDHARTRLQMIRRCCRRKIKICFHIFLPFAMATWTITETKEKNGWRPSLRSPFVRNGRYRISYLSAAVVDRHWPGTS